MTPRGPIGSSSRTSGRLTRCLHVRVRANSRVRSGSGAFIPECVLGAVPIVVNPAWRGGDPAGPGRGVGGALHVSVCVGCLFTSRLTSDLRGPTRANVTNAYLNPVVICTMSRVPPVCTDGELRMRHTHYRDATIVWCMEDRQSTIYMTS